MKTSLVSIDQTIYLVDKYQYFLRTFCRDFQGRWKFTVGYRKFVWSVHTYQQISILSHLRIL